LVDYHRKDNRCETYTVSNTDGVSSTIDLQTSGFEPVALSVDGADIVVRYSSSTEAAGLTILDGSVVTWELANPFNSTVYISTVAGSASDATVEFLITGGIQSGKRAY